MVSWVGSDSGNNATGANIALTLPSHNTDDVAIIWHYSDQDTGTHNVTGATYTQIFDGLSVLGRDMHVSVWARRFTSGSETNPTVTLSNGEEHSAAVHVFDNVHVDVPLADFALSLVNDDNIEEPSETVTPFDIEVTSDNAGALRVMAITHDDITTVGTPTGYTAAESITGAAVDHRQITTAYDVDIGNRTAAYASPTFDHVLNNNVGEYWTGTIILPNAGDPYITDFNTDETFSWGDTNLVITGTGFGATQGAGSVEIWDDVTGTTQIAQTIDSWGDTSIQIDPVQSTLPANSVLYLVVNDNAGNTSASFKIIEGLLPYKEAVIALDPDHFWDFDDNYNDTGTTGPTRDFTVGVVGTWVFSTTEICEDCTESLQMDSVTDRREITDSPNMNATISAAERTLGMWLVLDGTQQSLGAVYKEGGGVQNLAFLVGMGNILLAQMADTPGNPGNVQAWSDFALATGRPYHICMRYSFDDTPREFLLYIDGIEQTNTDGNPMSAGAFDSHVGDVDIGDPDANLETGGTDIAYAGQEAAKIACFGTWSDNSAGTNAGGLDPVTEIRDVLFRRGAIPDDIITTGTESAMQTALDSTADTRVNWPLSYRIEPVTGGGDLELTMTDKVFDALITSHLEWRGASGDTLTIVNEGTSNLEASKCFATLGGTITVINTVTVRVTAIDANDLSVVQNCRVLLEAAAGGPLSAGTDILLGLTNASGIIEDTTFRFTSNQPVTGRARKGTTSPFYKEAPISGTITANGIFLTAVMVPDE